MLICTFQFSLQAFCGRHEVYNMNALWEDHVQLFSFLCVTDNWILMSFHFISFHFIYFRSVDPYRGIISHGYRTCQKIIVGFTYNNIYSISYD